MLRGRKELARDNQMLFITKDLSKILTNLRKKRAKKIDSFTHKKETTAYLF